METMIGAGNTITISRLDAQLADFDVPLYRTPSAVPRWISRDRSPVTASWSAYPQADRSSGVSRFRSAVTASP
jgi:hypothetical protein